MLEEEAALLEGAKEFQVAGSKYKEVTTGDEKEQRPSKKVRGKQPEKYRRGAAVKIGGSNPCKRCVCTGQDCLVHLSRWVINLYLSLFFNNSPFHSRSLTCAGYTIEFWECSSKLRWRFHFDADKDSKAFSALPSYCTKTSWDFCKKSDCDNLSKLWKMTFQASDGKGNHFLDLLDSDLNVIEPLYSKGGPWLQAFGHSNSLCAQASKAITNHAPIGEYRLQFFPNMDFACPYNNYPIETRKHILHDCQRFNRYWNLRRDTLSHFVMFLTANPNAFAFINT